jgi:hypothetical protein
VRRTSPGEARDDVSIEGLMRQSIHMHVGPVPAESYQFHRIVPKAASRLEGRVQLEAAAGRSHVYLRARQRNGHMAWASPVFADRR